MNVVIAKNKENNFLPDVLVFNNSKEPINITSWKQLQEILVGNTLVKLIIKPIIKQNCLKCKLIFEVIQILILEDKH